MSDMTTSKVSFGPGVLFLLNKCQQPISRKVFNDILILSHLVACINSEKCSPHGFECFKRDILELGV